MKKELRKLKKEFIIDKPLSKKSLVFRLNNLVEKGIQVEINSDREIIDILFPKKVHNKARWEKEARFIYDELSR